MKSRYDNKMATTLDGDELMLREFREVFGGRFTAQDTRRIFRHVNWNRDDAINFVLKNEAEDISGITSQSQDTIDWLKTDPDVMESLRGGIKSRIRQFACDPCDHVWWYHVPLRKEVSKCRLCLAKYNPVPRDCEWGWAVFDCRCGNQFSGFGQMGVTVSKCFKCGRNVTSPTRIISGNRRQRGYRRSRNRHSCEAQDCSNRTGGVLIHDNDPNRVYDDEDGFDISGKVNFYSRKRDIRLINVRENRSYVGFQRKRNKSTCVHPESRIHKKQVITPSTIHVSTGSTVATFLPQDGAVSRYQPLLPSISEDDDDGI